MLYNLIFFVVFIVVSVSLVYLTIALLRRHRELIGYNIIPLFLMSLFMGGYLIYIDEGGPDGDGGWKNFSGFGAWLFVALFTTIFLLFFSGLYILVNRKRKPQPAKI